MQTSPTKSENLIQLIQNYRYSMNLMVRCAQDVLSGKIDLHVNTVILMRTIGMKGAMSQHEIAARMQISDAAISRQIALLVEKEYIHTKQDPSNRRKVLVSLSAKGRRLVKTADRIVAQEFERILTDVPDETLQAMTEYSSILQDHLIASVEKPAK